MLGVGRGFGENVMSRTRAFRRHHRERMIKKALGTELIRSWYPEDFKQEAAVRFHNRLAPCSCYGCGNQRHNDWQPLKERLTMQERKLYNALEEGLEEYEHVQQQKD